MYACVRARHTLVSSDHGSAPTRNVMPQLLITVHNIIAVQAYTGVTVTVASNAHEDTLLRCRYVVVFP